LVLVLLLGGASKRKRKGTQARAELKEA